MRTPTSLCFVHGLREPCNCRKRSLEVLLCLQRAHSAHIHTTVFLHHGKREIREIFISGISEGCDVGLIQSARRARAAGMADWLRPLHRVGCRWATSSCVRLGNQFWDIGIHWDDNNRKVPVLTRVPMENTYQTRQDTEFFDITKGKRLSAWKVQQDMILGWQQGWDRDSWVLSIESLDISKLGNM